MHPTCLATKQWLLVLKTVLRNTNCKQQPFPFEREREKERKNLIKWVKTSLKDYRKLIFGLSKKQTHKKTGKGKKKIIDTKPITELLQDCERITEIRVILYIPTLNNWKTEIYMEYE